MVKVAVIGLGTMGQTHLEAWSRMKEVSLVAVSGQNKEKTERLAAQYGVKAHYSLEQLLSETDFDVLDICLPTYLHKEYTIAAAAAGKHIICEKPLARNAEEAEQMIQACEKHQVKLFPGHTLRFCPEYAAAHDHIKQGRLGEIGIVRLSRLNAYPKGWNNWFAEAHKSGGVILDLLIHDIDWLLWTFGDAQRVTAQLVSVQDQEHPLEYALLNVRMKDGTIALLEGSWAHTGFSSSFEISGSKGMLAENMEESAPLQMKLHAATEGVADVIVPESTLKVNPYERQLKHFIDCLLHNKSPIISPRDGWKAIELVKAAYASIESGQPVNLGLGGDKS